jgi:twitching motility two-component system response regulator PilH
MSTVLIVDDVQTDRELLGKVVQKAGHQPIYCSDGKQAISDAKTHKPGLIFMDVVMPGTDGFAACRAIKKDPDTANIPVVLVTSKGTDSDKFWGKKQGADDHVPKPFNAGNLTDIMKRFLK